MIGRKLVVALLLSFVLVGGIASAAYVHSTVAQYHQTVPCNKLKGIAGLLQKAHFVDVANCQINLQLGGCVNPGALCVLGTVPSGDTTYGLCRTTYSSCVCGRF